MSIFVFPLKTQAQAWVNPAHTLSTSLSHSLNWSDSIVADGIRVPGGTVINQQITLEAEYVPIDNLAIRAAIPFVLPYYGGSGGFLGPHGDYDDGSVHFVPQDFRLDARYMIIDAPIAITPLLGVSLPMSHYEVQGFAAAGRGLKQMHFGISLGMTLAPWLPELYLHGIYEFSLVERFDIAPETASFSQNRSSASLQIGYFFSYDFQAYIASDLYLQHGGLNFGDYGSNLERWSTLPKIIRDYHDPILHERSILLGGGMSYALSDSLYYDVYFRLQVEGNNTREARIIGNGISWQLGI
ncbi:MAG: hypothetical protein IPJ88_10580 [Myxococcales bacterium]|nr:MAG: hypothetical protein IPJ88_10580 [Myxococcales bacterium]